MIASAIFSAEPKDCHDDWKLGRRLEHPPGVGAGVSPALAAAIDAARDLAWRPTANLGAGLRYTERREAYERLCELLPKARLPTNADDELRFLLAAMRRVATCSFSNRRGEPYYWRRQQIYELRGCLVVWDRSVQA